MNKKSEKPAQTWHFPSEAEPVEIDYHPVTMPPGTVLRAVLKGEPVVLVGIVPTAQTAILCPKGWRMLQRWKLTRLRIVKGALRVCGEGRASGYIASRFLLKASGNHLVRHRNGDPFDIRIPNIVVISCGLMNQAKIEAARGPEYKNPDVRWVDQKGHVHCHSGKPLKTPSARERIAKAVAPPEPKMPLGSPQGVA